MTKTTDSAANKSAASPEALLKAAVSGAKPGDAKPADSVPAAPDVARAGRRIDPLTVAIAAAGLALGTLVGAGGALVAMPRSDGTGVALAEVAAGLEANRLEAARLAAASDRLDTSLAALREAADAARIEAKSRGAALTDRVGKLETALTARIAALGERMEQVEKDRSGRIAALPAPTDKHVAATPVPAAKAEPTQTGSLAEAKPKPAIVESWAVRDVYDGTAMLEDRRRRLVEVAVGDTVPGVGRVEGMERRGREWVVVTRQGLVTPQPW